jgi:ACR3 family arsenite efflux pump ArsB
VGSIGFLLTAAQRPQRFLVVLFVLWVLSPFVAMMLAGRVAKSWPGLARALLYSAMLVLTVGSLASYEYNVLRPRTAQAAFAFVVTPLVSWVLIVVIVSIAALISRRRYQR